MRMRRLHAGILVLLGSFGSARGEDSADRPLLKIDGSPGEQEEGGGGRRSSRLGKPKASVEEKGEGEEPMLPGSVPARPALKMRYHGVAPGREELPPKAPKLPLQKGPQRLTWPGFQIKDGKPTLFLQLSGPVEYTVNQKPGEVIIALSDTVVPLRNNLRPLLVQDFGTAVKGVRFERQKGRVVVHVQIKGPLAHTERMDAAENGYQMLLVQFSPVPSDGDEPRAPPAAKPVAQAKPAPAPQAQVRPAAAVAPASAEPLDLPEAGLGTAWTQPRTLKSGNVERGGSGGGNSGGAAGGAAPPPPPPRGGGW